MSIQTSKVVEAKHLTKGEDNIGKFQMFQQGNCPVCRATVGVSLRYTSRTLKITDYVKNAPSFLLQARSIGVSCGCYGRMQRQIAHIEGGKR